MVAIRAAIRDVQQGQRPTVGPLLHVSLVEIWEGLSVLADARLRTWLLGCFASRMIRLETVTVRKGVP